MDDLGTRLSGKCICSGGKLKSGKGRRLLTNRINRDCRACRYPVTSQVLSSCYLLRSSRWLKIVNRLPKRPKEFSIDWRKQCDLDRGVRLKASRFIPTCCWASSSLPPADPEEEAAKLRAKYTRFRILVIGRANAGKTTLLKRVCNTTEEPSIYDGDKNLVSYPSRLIAISQSHCFFIDSSNRPRRCWLSDFCTYLRIDGWF